MDRRTFLTQTAIAGLVLPFGSAPVKAAASIVGASKNATILNTARNCIFINMLGAPSHVDTFDLKPGPWHDQAVGWEPGNLDNGALWPTGIMPNLAARSDRFSLIRSLYTNEVNHQRAQFRLETAHPFIAAKTIQDDIAPLGTVLSFELEDEIRRGAVFTPFVSIGSRPKESTLFDNRHTGLFFTDGLHRGALEHGEGERVFNHRYRNLLRMDPLKNAPSDSASVSHLWHQANRLMGDPRVVDVFDIPWEEVQRYGVYGRAQLQAFKILKQDAGARFINLGIGGYWDDHANIYTELQSRLPYLDIAVSALLDDLEATPGKTAGKSLLDETLVIMAGEFGRTPGELNDQNGRHHHGDAYSALIAGGGVRGGRIIGATDDLGATITDIGWNADRPISTTDLAATVFSAMGIDYTKRIEETPSGRTYRYTAGETWMTDAPRPILELF